MKMSFIYNQGPLQEMFEVMMDSAYHYGDEKLVLNLFVFYSEQFNLKHTPLMLNLMLNSKEKEKKNQLKLQKENEKRKLALQQNEPNAA